ncbi:hypothetical protein Tco_0169132 [Tanacetum coccineum]
MSSNIAPLESYLSSIRGLVVLGGEGDVEGEGTVEIRIETSMPLGMWIGRGRVIGGCGVGEGGGEIGWKESRGWGEGGWGDMGKKELGNEA